MKRATLLLDDAIYQRAKNLSRAQGVTLKEILNDLLRKALSKKALQRSSPLHLPLHRQIGPQAGIDIADRQALYDKIEAQGLRRPSS